MTDEDELDDDDDDDIDIHASEEDASEEDEDTGKLGECADGDAEDEPSYVWDDELDGYFDYNDKAARERREQVIFHDFLRDIKPALYDFLARELQSWEYHFEQRASELLASKGRLEDRLAELEHLVVHLAASRVALSQRENAVTERERAVAAKEEQVAQELSKLQAVRASLTALLESTKQ